MATYDFEGMFGDKYSTEQAINSAMFNEAMSFGQLDRSKYAPMTASTFGQEYMAGAGMAGLLGGQHPMMKRQNLLDEIQKKFPDPRTPAELNELAAELSKNGFGDLAMQVKQVAMEMSKNEATKAYQTSQLNKPSSDDYKKIGRTLQGSVLNTDVIDAYLGIVEPELVSYNDKTYKAGKQNWNDRRDSRLEEVKGLIQAFADSYQVAGTTKQDIQAAIGDDAALTEKFIAWIGTSGNRDVADNLLTAMGRLNAESDDGDDGDGTTKTTEVTAKDYPITYEWNERLVDSTFDTLDRNVAEGKTLSKRNQEIYNELKKRKGLDKIAMTTNYNDGAWWAS